MNRDIVSKLALIFTDALAVLTALMLSHFTRVYLDRFKIFDEYDGDFTRFLFSGLLLLFMFVIFFFSGLYTRRNDFWEETRRIWIGIVILSLFCIVYIFALQESLKYSRFVIALLFINLLILLPLGRVLCKRWLYNSGFWGMDAFVVGHDSEVSKLCESLKLNWYLGYNCVTKDKDAKIIFIATAHMSVERLQVLISRYKKEVAEVVVIPYLSNIGFANAEIVDLRVGQLSMINIQNQLFRTRNIVLKKSLEILLVLLLLPPFIVVYIVIALCIRLDSRGDVLFKQHRLGKDGKIFTCYKFRTMYNSSDKILREYLQHNPDEIEHYELYHKYLNDPRITRVGRWLRVSSLDELPQILNILKFDMSLIGPRPYMIDEREKLGEHIDTILHVKPGITGFWQIKGRNSLSFARRVELDVWYIQNWSLWLDFIIFVKTFEVLITRRGAK